MTERTPDNKPKIDVDALLSRVDIYDVVNKYVPLTKSGAEYEACCPFHTESTPSFKVNTKKQIYHCFGCGAHGDAIKFVQEHLGLDFVPACEALAGGNLPTVPEGQAPAPAKKPKQDDEDGWQPLMPVPEVTPDAPKAHIKRGLPSEVYPYYAADGALLGYVYRFVTSTGGKETLPLVWAKHSKTGHEEWRWMQWPQGKRPIYGLDRLAAKPDAWVLLVEGEKCADVPRDILTKCAIVSWSGGCKAIDKTDWTPLIGRNIYAWPDCDAKRHVLTKAEKDAGVDPLSKPLLPEHEQPGVEAMLRIKQILQTLEPNTGFKMVGIPAPGTVKSGWDIADAIADGWALPRLREFILNTREYLPAPDSVKGNKQISTARKATAEDADQWHDFIITDNKGKWLDSRENVSVFLDNHPSMKGLVSFDEFSLRIVKNKPAPWDKPFADTKPWDDNDSLELAFWMASIAKLPIRSLDNINHGIKLSASRHAHDPLVEYLDRLVWDGNHRNKYWLTDFAGVKPTEYSQLAGPMFLIGMVARAYRPGCIMRTMPVFEGVQFRGKSSVARILAGKWFSDSPVELKGKDGFINIQGIWLQEIAEMGSFNNQEAPIIKAYLSSASDRFRSPFDKYARDYPRRTVFFGTTNEEVYLRDKTGNSRFWPFKTEEVGNIDLDGLTQARDQLFAEAVHAFKAGERWHPLENEQIHLFAPEQSLREYDDPWESMVYDYLQTNLLTQTSVSDVLSDCLEIEPGKQTQANSIQVGKILTRLGWKKSRPDSQDAKRKRLYLRPTNVNQSSGEDDDSLPI